MQLLSKHPCFAGEQRFYQHESSVTQTTMKFGVYVPPQALQGRVCPVVMYLAGLTCTEETFAIKAHAQQVAASVGLILVSPDTSPRGEQVAKGDHWDLGLGAGFYVNATQAPWAAHYQMESYLCEELISLINAHFATGAWGLMGHSMGGHGALTLAFRHPQKFASVSAIAPICAPMDVPWGQKAFRAYLGDDQTVWAGHDASRLIAQVGAQFDLVLVDQGGQDQFLPQLLPAQLEAACHAAKQPIMLRHHPDYDHGYYFIQSVMADHLHHHAARL